MKNITYKSFLLFVFISLFDSCASLTPIDKKKSATNLIVDKSQLNWYPNTKYDASDSVHRRISQLDTFAIIKPVIDVNKIINDDWIFKSEGLDASIPAFELKEDLVAKNYYELDWYSYIHNSFNTFKNHYLPNITASDYEIIKNEIHSMENIFDADSLKTYTMSDKLYEVLSKYPAQYYVLHSLKERYCTGFNPYTTKSPKNFIRMRVFIFNKKNRKILYYNKIYGSFNQDRYLGIVTSNYTLFTKRLMRKFNHLPLGRWYYPI